MNLKNSLFKDAPDIIPVFLSKGMAISDFVDAIGQTSFEARNVYRGARLFRRMIDEDDMIWLGIAGAGIAGGMGGMVISLIERGFIDVICSTGAQVYHDLHFAFDLPVKAIRPHYKSDDVLRRQGDTRIYDIGIREKETLRAQDKIIRRFVKDQYEVLSKGTLASWEFNYHLGNWVNKTSKYPERSFVAVAAKRAIPIFWDSMSNHSIAMNFARTDLEGYPLSLSGQKDVFDSAAITYSAGQTGFIMLGGGGPKNFIQQTGPTISQVLGINFKGADRGLQICSSIEKEGSLSSCTFNEAVTWGKYRSVDEDELVQIWGEYSVIFPLLAAYVVDQCETRPTKNVVSKIPSFIRKLKETR
jgi:deoxyhypusine synthase